MQLQLSCAPAFGPGFAPIWESFGHCFQTRGSPPPIRRDSRFSTQSALPQGRLTSSPAKARRLASGRAADAREEGPDLSVWQPFHAAPANQASSGSPE
jgi:hypothetical protein